MGELPIAEVSFLDPHVNGWGGERQGGSSRSEPCSRVCPLESVLESRLLHGGTC